LKLFKKHATKVGDSPGTIVYTGDVQGSKTHLHLITYDANFFQEKEVSVDDISKIIDDDGMKWLNVVGIHKPELLEQIGSQFGIHPLVLEDIANTSQQPKIEDYSDFIFATMKMFYVDSHNEIKMEHINFVLKKNILISFQEVPGDVFAPVRKRIEIGRKRLRESGHDYLLYCLMDAIVDNYFVILLNIEEKIESLKKSISNYARKDDLIVLDKLQGEMAIIQQSVEPLKKIIPELDDYDSPLIGDSHSIYFRDLHDHINQISSTTFATKEKLSSMTDFYLSVVSNRTNEVMKTLALVATICVPITVVAGIYGMNFQNMPELSSPFGYPLVLASMAGIALSLYGYFRKKRWT
jgi:magnesium transporter